MITRLLKKVFEPKKTCLKHHLSTTLCKWWWWGTDCSFSYIYQAIAINYEEILNFRCMNEWSGGFYDFFNQALHVKYLKEWNPGHHWLHIDKARFMREDLALVLCIPCYWSPMAFVQDSETRGFSDECDFDINRSPAEMQDLGACIDSKNQQLCKVKSNQSLCLSLNRLFDVKNFQAVVCGSSRTSWPLLLLGRWCCMCFRKFKLINPFYDKNSRLA